MPSAAAGGQGHPEFVAGGPETGCPPVRPTGRGARVTAGVAVRVAVWLLAMAGGEVALRSVPPWWVAARPVDPPAASYAW